MSAPDRDEQRQQEEDERQQQQERKNQASLPSDPQSGDEEAINSPVIINR